jgi:predicted O-methyltransferase YrrM
MALALPPAGRIWTIDPDARRTDIARSYFKHAGEDDYIEIFNTPVLELLENFPHRNLDVVFIRAAVRDYRVYLDLVVPMLKLSGLVILDDCAVAGAAFNDYFLSHEQLDATILPLGGGIGLGARKQ